MTIRPVVLGGMIQRTDDVGVMKHQEDSKPVVDQQNIQTQVQKEEKQKREQVKDAENSEMMDEKYDAKEKGKNQYRRAKSNKQKAPNHTFAEEGVIAKGKSGSFDIKI